MTDQPQDPGAPREPASPREPEYGQRIPDELWEDFLEAERARAVRHDPAPDPAVRPRALRRLFFGISLALCLLGLLLFFGLAASGHPRWSAVGALPLLAGVGGGVAVLWRLPRSLREKDGPRVPRRAARWFWLPVGMALLGVGALVVSYLVPGLVQGGDVWVRNVVVLWAEIGFTLLLMSSIVAGLVALALWTAPDDDETILRRTDYAERAREKGRTRRSGRAQHYDSDWVRGSGGGAGGNDGRPGDSSRG